jgi:anthranilate phosphoribosyltransferase
MKQYIESCLAGRDLSEQEASDALELIMTGQASDPQVAGLLVAIRSKGESVAELVGFARTMRRHAVTVHVDDPDAIDMCGTGGDGLATANISTIASFVVAGAGVTVAKHGNRSVSSQTGSADLLSALGVNVQASSQVVEKCVNEAGIAFLFAPLFHPAMKHVANARKELGFRTIFNILGPITNPARVKRQLIGTYDQTVASALASALTQLETGRASVVHSSDGMDEVSLAGSTTVFEVNGEHTVRRHYVHPEDFGLRRTPVSELRGGDSQRNAEIALGVLDNQPGPVREVVLANAAMGIYVSGKSKNLMEAVRAARESLESGRARQKLTRLAELTRAA